MKTFSLDWNYLSFTQMKKYAFQNSTLPACVKTEVGRRFVVNSASYKFQNHCEELEKMQVNIQGVEHDARRIARIEQIDSYSSNFFKVVEDYWPKNIRVP